MTYAPRKKARTQSVIKSNKVSANGLPHIKLKVSFAGTSATCIIRLASAMLKIIVAELPPLKPNDESFVKIIIAKIKIKFTATVMGTNGIFNASAIAPPKTTPCISIYRIGTKLRRSTITPHIGKHAPLTSIAKKPRIIGGSKNKNFSLSINSGIYIIPFVISLFPSFSFLQVLHHELQL